jgi:hypothetical protein
VGFVAQRGDGQLWREALAGQQAEVGLVVVTHAQHRDLACGRQFVDIVEVGWLVRRLPGRHVDGIQRRQEEVDQQDQRQQEMSSVHGHHCTPDDAGEPRTVDRQEARIGAFPSFAVVFPLPPRFVVPHSLWYSPCLPPIDTISHRG